MKLIVLACAILVAGAAFAKHDGSRLQYLWYQSHDSECPWYAQTNACKTLDADYPVPSAADIAAVTDEQIAEWRTPKPLPHTTVPLLDADGKQIGTASLYVYAGTMQPVASTNSASPVRPASVQLDEFRRAVKALNAAKAEIDKLKADIGKVQAESAQLKSDVDSMKKAGGK